LKKSKSRQNTLIGKLFFIIPILIIAILVVYAYVNLNSSATLMVQARTTGGALIQVPVTVNGMTGETPWTLSLGQGNYVVTFATIEWYYPPPSRDVSLQAGQTEYAVSTYKPITKVISVTPSSFNSTTVTALHDITPVVWLNRGSSPVVFSGPLIGRTVIPGMENFTYTFPAAGSYVYTSLDSNQNVTIDVQ
jgi:hypothetical protein